MCGLCHLCDYMPVFLYPLPWKGEEQAVFCITCFLALPASANRPRCGTRSKDEPSVDTGHDLCGLLWKLWTRLVPNTLGKLRPRVAVGLWREMSWYRLGLWRSQQWPCGPRVSAGVIGRRSWVSRRNRSTEGNVEQTKTTWEAGIPEVIHASGGELAVCDISQVWIDRCLCSLLPFSWCSWETGKPCN